MKRRSIVVAALCLAALACTSSPEPRFHALVPQNGSSDFDAALRVELRRPSLPGYLDRPQIARREGPTRLRFEARNQWGAPLDELVGATLAENLAQRLPKSTVFAENRAVSSTADVVVEVDFQRFEPTSNDTVELSALVYVRWLTGNQRGKASRRHFVADLESGATSEVVMKMSALLARLADAIVASLETGAPSPVAGQTNEHCMPRPL